MTERQLILLKDLVVTHARASALWLAAVCLAVNNPSTCYAQLVFVADGAGDFRCCSTMLRRAAKETGSPLDVETFVWSHGYGRSFADQMDTVHALAQGEQLARVVRARLASDAGLRINLVGHSAGCGVVLVAAQHLPPESIGCMVMLAPSVPADTDLAAALRATRDGIHVFCSHEDRWLMRAAGILEWFKSGRLRPTAGIAGFRPVTSSGADPFLVRLRTYPWSQSLTYFGHDGGHFGGYQPAFVQAFVLPLLAGKP